MRWSRFAAAAAASMLALQPALAADAFGELGGVERRTGAFVGANVRLPLGAATRAKPTARLQLTTSYDLRSARELRSIRPPGLEIGASGLGKPELFVGGARLSDHEGRLGLTGDSWVVPLLIVVAVTASVVALTAATSD
ncbi:MAG TPA: hypothetical protein VF727_07870 [Allosphingosinicella sp.]